jgi:serine protease Do
VKKYLFKAGKTISIAITVFFVCTAIYGTWYIHEYFRKSSFSTLSRLGSINVSDGYRIKNGTDEDLKNIIYESQKLVVYIEAVSSNSKNIGSGFLFDNKGDIITNAHVLDGATEVSIKTADTSAYKGTIIGKANDIDVALIRVPELAGKDPMIIAHDGKVDIGDKIIALGSPFGLQNTATLGNISGLNRNFKINKYTYNDVYQISAPITSGNSGGPLIRQSTGEVIGINSAKLDEGNIGFSIPINQIIEKAKLWASNPSANAINQDIKVKEDVNEDTLKYSAEYIVGYLYDSLDSQDYLSAYFLLGSEWHSTVSYERFRKGYLSTQSVKIKSMTSRMEKNNNVEVTAIIEAVDNIDGDIKTKKYKTDYIVGYENNKLKILSGKATKL